MTYEDGRWQDGVGEAGQPVRAASIRRQNLDLVARPQVADDEGDFACRKDFFSLLAHDVLVEHVWHQAVQLVVQFL